MFGRNSKLLAMQKKKARLFYYIVIPISFLVLLFTFMTAYEYTAVADIRESLTKVDKSQTLAYGKVLFETRGCASCHTITPNRKSLGPNLFGIAERQPETYIRQSIIDPGAIIVSGYDDVVMPDFGDILDDRQVNALVEYLSSIK